MSKKILILSSTPRKNGNSRILSQRFAEGAREAGHQVEMVELREKDLHPCNGCGACARTKACAQKDDMAPILDAMVTADTIVMATPVYFYTMCAQMKMAIDRTVPRYTEITGKEFYFLVTAADGNKKAMERTLEGFRGFTSCLEDPKERGVVLGVGAWEAGTIRKTRAMDEAYAMGQAV
jgi:multimeric flavodoxin WrbA